MVNYFPGLNTMTTEFPQGSTQEFTLTHFLRENKMLNTWSTLLYLAQIWKEQDGPYLPWWL